MFKRLLGTLNETAQKIKSVIKENTQFISLLEKVVQESKEGIISLQNYAASETPSLRNAITSLAELLTNIENARAEKIASLKEKFIGPLNDLVSEADKLFKESKEAEHAKKALEKAEKSYEKEKAKKAKHKPANVPAYRDAVVNARERVEQEEQDVRNATETFNKVKLNKIKEIIRNLTDIEQGFHEKIIGMLGAVTSKANAIDIGEAEIIDEPEDSDSE